MKERSSLCLVFQDNEGVNFLKKKERKKAEIKKKKKKKGEQRPGVVSLQEDKSRRPFPLIRGGGEKTESGNKKRSGVGYSIDRMF